MKVYLHRLTWLTALNDQQQRQFAMAILVSRRHLVQFGEFRMISCLF